MKFQVQQPMSDCTSKAKEINPADLARLSSTFSFSRQSRPLTGKWPIKCYPDSLLTRYGDGMPRLGTRRPPMIDFTASYLLNCALEVSESPDVDTQVKSAVEMQFGSCDAIRWGELI